ncbi:hypothetical protein DRH27_00990 [Candidatus Falkowbacteria bacterium]|nr:MAG: hypothetical protein DRH27_00990 [Candidatus Falkowbacteria bacterium]
MRIEKWKDVLGNIKDNFQVEDEGSIHLDDEGGVDIEYIVFKGPLGRMRLEFITKPVVLDKKMTYSKRIGSETKIDYVYSEDEKTNILNAYKWDEDKEDWAEIDASSFED